MLFLTSLSSTPLSCMCLLLWGKKIIIMRDHVLEFRHSYHRPRPLDHPMQCFSRSTHAYNLSQLQAKMGNTKLLLEIFASSFEYIILQDPMLGSHSGNQWGMRAHRYSARTCLIVVLVAESLVPSQRALNEIVEECLHALVLHNVFHDVCFFFPFPIIEIFSPRACRYVGTTVQQGLACLILFNSAPSHCNTAYRGNLSPLLAVAMVPYSIELGPPSLLRKASNGLEENDTT